MSVRAVLILGAALLLAPLPAAAGGGSAGIADVAIEAVLDGQHIPVRQVGRHHCHDVKFPRIECFTRIRRLERRVAALLERLPLLPLAPSFVRVYEHASYGGASMYLSQNYANLGSIGWNDKISSYYVVNGGSGEFYEHALYIGIYDGFCCSQSVSNVGATYNDKFSSVVGDT